MLITELKISKILKYSIIALLVLGVIFRFVNLDKKVFWADETFTYLAVNGDRSESIVKQEFNGQVIEVGALQKYQINNPNRNSINTIEYLANVYPEHPPLYYLILKFWWQLFGSSVTATRSLSAVFSLLIFPSIYWLSLELFGSSLIAFVAVALIAISPFHVLYAQEARQYSLWTAMILLSSASLLRAIRLNQKSDWLIYSLTLVISCYTHIFSLLVIAAHGIYVIIRERFCLSQILVKYLIFSIIGVLLFIPWITKLTRFDAASWTSQSLSIVSLLSKWSANISRLFFDINLDSDSPLVYIIPPIILSLLLVIYAMYFLVKNTSQKTWLFILSLGLVTSLILILPDLIRGGRGSTVSRYLMPSHLSIELAVAYLLGTQINLKNKIWQLITVVIIVLGVVSCGMIAQADSWWNKKYSHYNPQSAHLINQYPQPLLISSDFNINLAEMLSLSHLLAPTVQLQLVSEPNIPKIPDNFEHIFVFNPSKNLKSGLTQEEYTLKPFYPEGRLWKLEKP